MNPILSFIIIEYHSFDDIVECIATIRSSTSLSYEVIVSSNSCYLLEVQERIWNTSNGSLILRMGALLML